MEIIVFIIPFITAIILLAFFREKVVWWEYGIIIAVPIAFILLLKLCVTTVVTSDIEYLGGYVTQLTHYDDWDETVMVPHTVTTGKTTTTIMVPERRYHPDTYSYRSSIDGGKAEHPITKRLYKTMKDRIGGPEFFRDMHRDYRSKDGDAHDIFFELDTASQSRLYDITESGTYQNKIKASEYSIFGSRHISKKEAKKLGLYSYPDIDRNLKQIPIIGDSVLLEDTEAVQLLNAIYGKKYQFRTFILLFDAGKYGIEISEKQKDYWNGGNKNEFIVCIGLDSLDNVIWCNPFSWADVPKLEVLTRDYFLDNPQLNISAYAGFLSEKIPDNWIRKEFKDFDYLSVSISNVFYIIIIILMIIAEIFLSIFVIRNSYQNYIQR